MPTNNAIDSNKPIEVSKGGTGASTLTQYGVLVGNNMNPITALAVGGTNTVLNGNSIGNPSFGALPVAALTNGTNGQTIIGGGSNPSYSTLTRGS